MGLFDKKYCGICGEKIGLLGNRKLEDGNLCRNCAKKLSPWFSGRKHSSVEEIRAQLAWREENKGRVASFRPTASFGDYYHIYIDGSHGTFTVSRTAGLTEENPDILPLSAITGCSLDVSESHRELLRDGPDSKKVSYRPPRYEYSYDFYCVIHVNAPYYSEMRFRLNPGTLRITTAGEASVSSQIGSSLLGGFTASGFQPQYDPNYQKFQRQFEEIRNALCMQGTGQAYGTTPAYGDLTAYGSGTPYTRIGAEAQPQPYVNGQADPRRREHPAASSASWFCPACGSPNTGNFCECCGTPSPVTAPC